MLLSMEASGRKPCSYLIMQVALSVCNAFKLLYLLMLTYTMFAPYEELRFCLQHIASVTHLANATAASCIILSAQSQSSNFSSLVQA